MQDKIMMSRMISVIVPTYNEEKNVVKCLGSLNKQSVSRKDYEIIVVDGHSMDKTVLLAKKYADKVIMQKSKGVGGARNDGAAVAKGDIIATTDADCHVPRDWLERIQDCFKKRKNVVGVYGPVKPIEARMKYKIFLGMNNALAYLLYKLNLAHLTVGANTAFRKKEFLEIGGYADYSAGDDYEMPFRLKKKGKMYFDRKVTVYFSMRRYEMFGTFSSIYSWVINVLTEVFKIKKDVRKYNKIDYEHEAQDMKQPRLKVYLSCNGLGLGHVGRILSVANVLQRRGNKVIFGTWGPAVEFARKEGFFCYELHPIDWKDKPDGSFDLLGTVVRTPVIFFSIIRTIFQEITILRKEKPDIVLSDASIGHGTARILGVPSLYVHHQMDFPLNNKIIRNIIRQIHSLSVKVATKGVVLDLKPDENIYPYSFTKINGITYTGPLVDSKPDDYGSQELVKKKLKINTKLCIILITGPKHSPFALEDMIMGIEEKLLNMKDWTFIIKAPVDHENRKNIRYVTWIDNIYELLKACDVVVSRSGYTTVCDIIAFRKKSILIPQPKQVEQETIANHMKEKRIACMIGQDELDRLPQLIKDTYSNEINIAELERVSDEINDYNAKQKIVDIIDEMLDTKAA